MCQPMPSVPESVCCHEIGQIWQKIEEQLVFHEEQIYKCLMET